MIGLPSDLLRACTWLAPVIFAALLGGCNSIGWWERVPETGIPAAPLPPPQPPVRLGQPQDLSGQSVPLTFGSSGNRAIVAPEIVLGTGPSLNTGAAASRRPEQVFTGSDVTLDFQNVDVRDVLKSVLGDLLQASYAIDPAVQGTVTLQTGRPIPRASVINVLTQTLQLSGITLVARDGLYFAVPVANAGRQAPVGGTSGFVARVVTPQYVAAADLERVLEPMLPPGTTMKSDPARNVLMISGTARDVAAIMEHVATFDIDALRGVSFALLPLRNGRAKDVANDVTNLLTAAGRSMTDMVKIMPIERMNAILVTSMQPRYLLQVRGWVERFDRGDGRSDQQLFVYRVQNGRATDIARVLRRALGLEGGETGRGGAAESAAADTEPASPVSGASPPTQIDTMLGRAANAPASATPAGRPPVRTADPLAGVASAAALAGAPMTTVRVTPDQANNALIITGSAQDYAPIEAALQKLDITPLQVLIEATVAEVTLTDELNLGLQYFIKSGHLTGIFAPNVAPGKGDVLLPPFANFPGFGFLPGANLGYAAGGTNVVLQALAKLATVRVLSSPNLMVLNNGTARLQVGDQVPIATQSATSTLVNTAQTVNSIDYRDTGIILNVTPRVNASGLVLLDITQEVSDASLTGSSKLDSPTISQRRVSSSVAINDGQTIGLAGLIREKKTDSTSGLPVLKDIPVVGTLFGTRSDSLTRTELIVLITPRVIRSRDDGDAITRELREKLALTVPVVARR